MLRSFDVIVAGQDQVDLQEMMAEFERCGYRVILCEGGPNLLGQLVAAGQLDELCLTLAPLMGGNVLPMSTTVEPETFSLRQVLVERDTLFLRYERAAR